MLDAFWATETACNPDAFQLNGIAVVERPATDGSEYVQLFRRGHRLQITCSASLLGGMCDAVQGHTLETVFDRGFLGRVLAGRIEQLVGPAYLGYLDAIEPAPDDPGVRLLDGGDAGRLEEFRQGMAAQDWEYSGLAPGQPIAGSFGSDRLLSAAGYEV